MISHLLSLPLFLPEEVKSNQFKQGLFHFGSFAVNFNYTIDYYKDFIEELFRLWMEEVNFTASTRKIDAELFMFLSEEAFSPKYHTPDNPIFLYHPEENWYQIRSDYVDAYIDLSVDPIQIYVPINPEGKPKEPLINFVQAVFNKILFVLEKLHMHAAAIEFNGSANLFFGDNGSGKTTITLSLAKSGGTILGEDHIVITRKGGSFYASGCDDIMRVTKQTENFYFEEELPENIQEFAGVSKKQIRLSNYFLTKPYTDILISNIFFPKLGSTFSITPMEKSSGIIYFFVSICRCANDTKSPFINCSGQVLIYD